MPTIPTVFRTVRQNDIHQKPFKAYSLCDNQAILTALGNDYGFEKIFVNQ